MTHRTTIRRSGTLRAWVCVALTGLLALSMLPAETLDAGRASPVQVLALAPSAATVLANPGVPRVDHARQQTGSDSTFLLASRHGRGLVPAGAAIAPADFCSHTLYGSRVQRGRSPPLVIF